MLGLRHIGAGRAAVIFSINPALIMLGAAWLFGERLNRRILGGMILAVGGSLIVAARGNPLLLLGALGTGEYLIFGCVFCWVSYSLIGRRVLTGIDALTATTATALIGGVMLLAVSLAAEGAVAWAGLAHIAPSIWLILLALSFGATLLAYLWYFEGIAALGAGSTAAYMTLIPVFAVLIAALWLQEPLTLSLVAGGTLTVCGMLLMQSGRRA
jgi:membrane protein